MFEMLAVAVLPAGLTYTFGRMVGRTREGWMLYFVDPLVVTITLVEGVVLFLALLLLTLLVERTSSAESAGRSASGSARTTAAPH